MLPVIICVDDEKIVLDSLYKELKALLENNYEIETACDGNEALELIDELKKDGYDIALIISDFTMPVMSGAELLEKAAAKAPNMAKILLTGHAEMHDISDTVNKSHLDKFLLKPWDSQVLSTSITEVLLNYQLKKDLQIHQSKAAERNMALELIAQVAQTGSFKWTPDNDIVKFSSQWAKTFEHKNPANDIDWYFSLIHPDDLESVKEHFNTLKNEDIDDLSSEFRIKDGNNKFRWVINNSMVDKLNKTGNKKTIICIEQDITDHKHKEKTLIEANKINNILKHISEQIVFLSSDRKVVWANRNEDGTVCCDTDFTCYHKWGHENPCANCPIEECIKTGSNVYAEVKTDNGKIYSTTATPIFDDNNELVGIVHSRLDVTKQKELEIMLQHNQKMESVGQLAAGIAHELNTPIQYISDNLNFLKRAFETIHAKLAEKSDSLNNKQIDAEELSQYIKDMFETEYELKESKGAFDDAIYGTSHISKIVSAMKDFAHPDSNSPEMSDVNQIVCNAVTITKNEWKYFAEVKTSFQSESLNISCMPGNLLQVIINMIVNSAHAIQDRMKITPEPGLIQISTSQKDGYAIIELKDNGNGIPENIKQNIYDPFFTTKEVGKGTGQGLAITHDIIVNKHQGFIEMESEIGKGTTFRLKLPLECQRSTECSTQNHKELLQL